MNDSNAIQNEEINALKFASNRSRDIFNLEQILKQKYQIKNGDSNNSNVNKRNITNFLNPLWQKNNNPLPRHLRRRTTSHRRRHVKQSSKNCEDSKNKKINRKMRRKPNTLNRNTTDKIVDTTADAKRLHTHVWHSKRFHMRNQWQHMIPMKRNDIGFEATRRAFLNNCTIHDASYFTMYEIKNTSYENISLLLKQVFPLIDNSNGLETNNLEKSSWTAEHVHNMCNNSTFLSNKLMYTYEKYPNGLIGTIDILFHLNVIWLFVHPSIAKQVENNLNVYNMNNENSSISYYNLNDKFSIFHFHGRENIFNETCMNNFFGISNKNDDNDITTHIHNNRKDETYLSLNLQDPRFVNYIIDKFQTKSKNATTSTSTTIFDQEHYENSIQTYSSDHIVNNMLSCSTNTTNKEELNIPNIPCIVALKSDLKKHKSTKFSSDKANNKTGSWIFILPSQWCNVFWNKFIMLNIIPVGIEDIYNIYVECNKCFFPYDYPDTNAGKQYMEDVCKLLDLQQKKKIKKHRINFHRLRQRLLCTPSWLDYSGNNNNNNNSNNKKSMLLDNVKLNNNDIIVIRDIVNSKNEDNIMLVDDGQGSEMFHPKSIQCKKRCIQSNLLSSQLSNRNVNNLYFLKVCIRSCRRGVPAFGGLISLPSIISNEGKDLLAHILKNNGIEEKRGVKDDSIPMFQEIGYITSGCRSIGTGQNIGISFCSMYLLYEYIDTGGEILLFRNRGSRIYRPAYFSIF